MHVDPLPSITSLFMIYCVCSSPVVPLCICSLPPSSVHTSTTVRSFAVLTPLVQCSVECTFPCICSPPAFGFCPLFHIHLPIAISIAFLFSSSLPSIPSLLSHPLTLQCIHSFMNSSPVAISSNSLSFAFSKNTSYISIMLIMLKRPTASASSAGLCSINTTIRIFPSPNFLRVYSSYFTITVFLSFQMLLCYSISSPIFLLDYFLLSTHITSFSRSTTPRTYCSFAYDFHTFLPYLKQYQCSYYATLSSREFCSFLWPPSVRSSSTHMTLLHFRIPLTPTMFIFSFYHFIEFGSRISEKYPCFSAFAGPIPPLKGEFGMSTFPIYS